MKSTMLWLWTDLSAEELWALEVPLYALDMHVKEKNYAIVDIVHIRQEPLSPVDWSCEILSIISSQHFCCQL